MDRVVGAVLGLACGDALGAPIEFMDQLTVRRRYGKITEMIGGGPWQAGEWTDDTGTTLCVAGGILEDAEDPRSAVGRRLLAWSESAKVVGPTVSAALANYRHGGDWVEAAPEGSTRIGVVGRVVIRICTSELRPERLTCSPDT